MKHRINWPKIILEIIALLAWVVVGMFISELIIAYPLYWLLGNSVTTPFWNSIYIIFSDLLRLVIIIGLPYFISKRKNLPFFATTREELGLKGLPTWSDVGLGPIAYFAYILLFSVVLQFLQNFSWFNANEAQNLGYSTLTNPADKVLAFIALAVITPIVEEVIFRGFLYGKIRARLPMIPSILLVSILFAVLHGQWNAAIAVFILSVLNCSLREITGTIYAGILAHMIMNGLATFIKYVFML